MATGIYESVLFELNQCRSNPSKYSSKLSNTLKYYKGKIFEKPGYPSLETQEGPENVQACIKYLKSVRPAVPLEWNDALSKAAQSHVDDIGPKGQMGHDSSDGSDASARVEKYGQWSGQLGENIDYGNCEGEDIVVSLLIDDGVLARGQRLNIMKREHAYVGIGFGYHAEYEYMCVVVFAEVMIEYPRSPPKSEGKGKEEEKEKEKEKEKVQRKVGSTKSNVKKVTKSAYETFEVTSYEREGLTDEDIIQVKTFFDAVDSESSGAIDPIEIKAAMENEELDLTNQSILNLLNEYNMDTSSKIDFDEFLDMISERMSMSNISQSKIYPKGTEKLVTKEPPRAFQKEPQRPVPKETPKSAPQELPKEPVRTTASPKISKPEPAKIPEPKPAPKAPDYPNLSKADIAQMKEVFDAYDSEGLGYIDLRDLVSSIQSGDYEEGSVEVIDLLLSLNYKGKRRVTWDELLGLLDRKSKEGKESKYKKSTYQKTEITTTKYSYSGEIYTKTTKKTTTKFENAAERVEPFDPTQYERPGLTEEEICEIKEAFDLFDREKCGAIETRDLKNAMEAQGFQHKSPTIFKMVCELDVEGQGLVNFEEFLDMMTENNVEDSSQEEIKKVFNLFDIDQTGYIELKNLKQIAKELGESLNEQEIIELITKSDADGDGKVSFEEFYNIMSRTTY